MRFMHMADVHLGAQPDKGSAWSRLRGEEIWETFRLSLEDAAREKVDLLLIAGDLFHTPPTESQLREVDYLFSRLSRTRVVLIAGNHDHLGEGCAYRNFSWSRNVVGLFSAHCECVRFPEIKTEVYGLSYDRNEIPLPLYDDLSPVEDPSRGGWTRILLAHGGDAMHIPLNREKLDASGFDYIALGHIHKPMTLIRGKAMFSGALEPIDCDDTGPHGYILGETKGRHLKLTFVKRAQRSYRDITISCTGADTTFSVLDALEGCIESKGPEDIYKVTLTGVRQAGSAFDTERLRQCGRVLRVEDRTSPAFDLEDLKRRYHGQLIGRFIESFEGGEMDLKHYKALQYGLEALLESRMNE